MYKLTVENQQKEKLILTQNPNYVVKSIDGLTPPTATINSAIVAVNDGAIFNSARVETRNIILSISPLFPVEENRNTLYRFFSIKREIKLYYESESKKVYEEGYVDSVDGSLFELNQTLTISVTCMNPYFRDQIETAKDTSSTIDLFEFPFSIASTGVEFSQISKINTIDVQNSGDVDTGMIIDLVASGTVTNPKIYNTETTEMFGINTTMMAGDKITISTIKNEKSVTLTRDGVESNIINQIVKGSSWLQLTMGDNVFYYECDAGADLLEVRFRYCNQYSGV